ncbi:MAG: hypothetical protein ACM3ZO_00675 [Clostridia bacterium]
MSIAMVKVGTATDTLIAVELVQDKGAVQDTTMARMEPTVSKISR